MASGAVVVPLRPEAGPCGVEPGCPRAARRRARRAGFREWGRDVRKEAE